MPIDPAELAALPSIDAAELLSTRMGIELVSLSLEEVVGRMPVAGNKQPFGLLHGGANGVLAETLGSTLSALHALPDRFPVGLELACTHHRSATSGWVTGTARPLHVGRSTSTSEIVITDDSGSRVATARLTCLHRDTRPDPGPSGRSGPTA
ncbi:phenylacetic acid degradation-related protein [Pseudonocardia dioxanivorans CB1190]|uniref:Phenylacetic acid degradation-related protein n=1 Tax=Pseudonocardia dioxanivorans (strain ATCC 55486 / DSM 44775 / JCM 13855 / CB1190) TaxID=675635 RepID=F4CN29_PSEUX|nr:hotdog fold thioesterase [Pseudonocardia dioxanivorans]AEA26042.1 phenylacetic acid degradation-related protein [Pseudonocardia dioxanivorans CB1190]